MKGKVEGKIIRWSRFDPDFIYFLHLQVLSPPGQLPVDR